MLWRCCRPHGRAVLRRRLAGGEWGTRRGALAWRRVGGFGGELAPISAARGGRGSAAHGLSIRLFRWAGRSAQAQPKEHSRLSLKPQPGVSYHAK
jgi:hypothetical protein